MFEILGTGKLVKGVVYDNVDTDSIKEEMFDSMLPVSFIKESPSVREFQIRTGLTNDEVMDYVKTSDVIDSLTRFDAGTGETRNLIIPKEALSENMVKELEKVDLGKGLNELWANWHFEECCMSDVEPEDFFKGTDEKVLHSTVDKDMGGAINAKFSVNGKKLSEEQFKAYAESNPELMELVNSLGVMLPVIGCHVWC